MTKPLQSPLRAAFFMILASAFIAGTTLIAKGLGNGSTGPALHPLQVSAGRFTFAFATLVILSPLLKLTFDKVPWRTHAIRSMAGWAGVSCMFAAAAQMPLAEATAISFLSPIATMILAIPLLGEKVGPVRWTAAAIAFAGALILIRPGTDAFQIAALIALVSAAFMGLEVVFIKRLTGNERPARILFINNGIGCVLAATAASFVWISPTATQWPMLIGIGIVMLCAQTCFIQAMRSADASYAMPFFYATLVFAAIYDFGVFDVVPEMVSMLGAAIIIAGALFLAFRERQRAREDASARETA